MKHSIQLIALSLLLSTGCKAIKPKSNDLIKDNVENIIGQQTLQTNLIEKSGQVMNPRTLGKDGSVFYIKDVEDWTLGFFPGSIWLTSDLTKDKKWVPLAKKYTEKLEYLKDFNRHHDVGFMVGCSYLTGYRLTGDPKYKVIIVQAAKALSTRFRPKAGVIQSWDVDRDWQSKKGWKCPVIIDNMMNLELLFEATKFSGDSSFYKIAVSHANTTLKNHFRDDNSCYHVVDYDSETGEVRKKQTAQGYSDESAWARGQTWALYGYTMCYRYTHNPIYLTHAQKVYDFIFTNKNLPADLIPYWDYNAPNIPNEPRDVSSAAITASALYELSSYLPNKKYKETADKIMDVLSTPAYRAEVGTNGNFILKHSVGSLPHKSEIDVPLNYADYYFLEALVRKRDLKVNSNGLALNSK